MNKKGVSLMALIITIIVMIILATFAMYQTNLILHRTQLAVFLDNFSKYSEQVEINSMNLKYNLGGKEKGTNTAQINYMVANGLKQPDDLLVFGYTTPVGYVLPDSIMRLYGFGKDTDTASLGPRLQFFSSVAYANDVLNLPDGPTYDIANSYANNGDPIPMVAYVIDDSNIAGFNKPNNIDGSAGREFYGDSNGSEYHFITSNGHVLTLPGYPVLESDGSMTFYISNDKKLYYVASCDSGLSIDAMNVNGDKVTEARPILGEDLAEAGPWGLTSANEWVNSYVYDPDASSFGTLGRYTSIGNPTQWKANVVAVKDKEKEPIVDAKADEKAKEKKEEKKELEAKEKIDNSELKEKVKISDAKEEKKAVDTKEAKKALESKSVNSWVVEKKEVKQEAKQEVKLEAKK
jgi:hypothetical protein